MWVRKHHLTNMDTCCYPKQRKAGFTALVTYLKGYTRHVAVRRINRLFPLNCLTCALSGRIIGWNLIYPRSRPTTTGRRSLWVSRWGGCLKKAWCDPKNSIGTWSQKGTEGYQSVQRTGELWLVCQTSYILGVAFLILLCNAMQLFGQGDLNLFAINLK